MDQTTYTRAEAEARIRSVPRTCRGPLDPESAKIVARLLADGNMEEARYEDAAGRPGCGFDFNDIVCAGPLNGQQREYTCPACGVTGVYTAPYFPLSD